MIRGFRHKGLEAFFRLGTSRGIQAAHAPKIGRILSLLDAASAPHDLDLPGYRLHELKGRDKGTWSVWVNGNWRITFKFSAADAELVDYLDYH
ncbi:Killer protein [Pseudolysobacter antarcticus]|uniref:Killer protein n=1 Tax=Pseudolysobacter antarcticus TaxID=2511995 RepID=A0A411HKN4_9GAMM|nr:type II toxin-antitoxin system RelE/ParE family toxin [Pseudolysobacter antarcticus]QBB71063.1 Killer protein [Pseudolysobacter antarcticus]